MSKANVKLWLFAVYVLVFRSAVERINLHLIGFTGYVSDLDRAVIQARGTRPPSKLEVWLSREFVASEKLMRQDAFEAAIQENT